MDSPRFVLLYSWKCLLWLQRVPPGKRDSNIEARWGITIITSQLPHSWGTANGCILWLKTTTPIWRFSQYSPLSKDLSLVFPFLSLRVHYQATCYVDLSSQLWGTHINIPSEGERTGVFIPISISPLILRMGLWVICFFPLNVTYLLH